LLLAISPAKSDPELTTYRIDDELLSYVETFPAKANIRRLEFKAENLAVEFWNCCRGNLRSRISGVVVV